MPMPLLSSQAKSAKWRDIVIRNNNWVYLISGISFSVIIWIVFKFYYPYPNLTFDSYYYVKAAVINTDVCGWPIGYAKFIRWAGIITHSANFLVGMQFFFLQISFLYFLCSIRYLLNLGHFASVVVFIFLFINPLFPFSCNHILSDPLFTSLSVIWATQLLWIIYNFKPYMVFTQALLVVMIFSLRYNAIYYPIITVFVFIIANTRMVWRLAGVGLTLLFLLSFIEYTSIQMEKTVGIRKYSYSGGWKLASNALYMYEFEYKHDTSVVPDKFKVIDSMVRKYFDAPHYSVSLYRPDEEVTLGSFYMAVDVSPLMQFMHYTYNDYTWTLDFQKTARFGPFYQEYGSFLIKKHPLSYFRFVILPHILSYVNPYPEMFAIDLPPFELWDDNYGQITRKWFGLKTLMVPYSRIEARVKLLSPFPNMFTIIHILFFLLLIGFVALKYYRLLHREIAYSIGALSAICILNFAFVTSTTTGVLRYQFFIVVLELTLITMFVEVIYGKKDG